MEVNLFILKHNTLAVNVNALFFAACTDLFLVLLLLRLKRKIIHRWLYPIVLKR